MPNTSLYNQDMLHENILESMDNGVIALDFEGKIITFNAAASRILGIAAEDALGKYYPEVFFAYEGNDDFNDVLINVIDTRQTHMYQEVPFTRDEETVIPLGITSSLLHDDQGHEYGVVSVFSDLTEIKKRQFLQDTLTRYVTKQVVDLILEHPESIVLDGEEREATILFSDIRAFTSLSEKMHPTDVVLMLREYFTLMVDAVFEYQGTIDKFIGDALMAIFGAPTPQPNHAELAVLTALRMQTLLEEFNEQRQQKGLLPVEIGVGIHSGNVVVGNIGSEQRLEYTAIGDSVNLASRLESINKEYGTHIIITEMTLQQIQRELVCRKLDEVRVKGRREPVKIYDVLGTPETIPDGMRQLCQLFEQGTVLYRKRQWYDALECFRKVLHDVPDDGPSQCYLERCARYQKDPPPGSWDGIFEMTTK
jgi:adenylate cyclase